MEKEGRAMKTIFGLAMALGMSLAITWPAQARDDKLFFKIAEVLASKDAQEKLDGSVKFFFGDQPHPTILTKLGSDVSNLKTNAVGKSDERACHWVFLSTMVSLQNRAKQLGANAVVNIISFYRKVPMSSATDFECHAGATIAGVALKGDFVKIADK
jgi:uncharacterized protein YbjQ (UPF0145 family)